MHNAISMTICTCLFLVSSVVGAKSLARGDMSSLRSISHLVSKYDWTIEDVDSDEDGESPIYDTNDYFEFVLRKGKLVSVCYKERDEPLRKFDLTNGTEIEVWNLGWLVLVTFAFDVEGMRHDATFTIDFEADYHAGEKPKFVFSIEGREDHLLPGSVRDIVLRNAHGKGGGTGN